MVENQLRARGIDDGRVLAQMGAVPRHCFVPKALESQAYDDHPLAIGNGQTISQPYMVACMTALLQLGADDVVLEIGTGSGYQTAVLAGLCRAVYTVERDANLHERARACLQQLRYENVRCVVGDGSLGHPEGAPYDAILVTAGSPRIPKALKEQLAEGGRILCPVGNRNQQQLLRLVRRGSEFESTSHTNCIFVPLVGTDGWHSAQA